MEKHTAWENLASQIASAVENRPEDTWFGPFVLDFERGAAATLAQRLDVLCVSGETKIETFACQAIDQHDGQPGEGRGRPSLVRRDERIESSARNRISGGRRGSLLAVLKDFNQLHRTATSPVALSKRPLLKRSLKIAQIRVGENLHVNVASPIGNSLEPIEDVLNNGSGAAGRMTFGRIAGGVDGGNAAGIASAPAPGHGSLIERCVEWKQVIFGQIASAALDGLNDVVADLFRSSGVVIEGILPPPVKIVSVGYTLGWTITLLELGTIFTNLFGAPLILYTIDFASRERMAAYMDETQACDLCAESCQVPILVSPNELRTVHGISTGRVVLHPGKSVFVRPGVIHMVLATGTTAIRSRAIATQEWHARHRLTAKCCGRDPRFSAAVSLARFLDLHHQVIIPQFTDADVDNAMGQSIAAASAGSRDDHSALPSVVRTQGHLPSYAMASKTSSSFTTPPPLSHLHQRPS